MTVKGMASRQQLPASKPELTSSAYPKYSGLHRRHSENLHTGDTVVGNSPSPLGAGARTDLSPPAFRETGACTS